METLDLLITKFKEFKEELKKNSPLHDTVQGFMTGLKAAPKGSPERGKFITAHMNHGPFLSALAAHPQGEQVKGMLNSHLNSRANAGFKPGQAVAVAKSDTLDEDLDKALGGFKDKSMMLDASRAAHKDFITKPLIPTPHKQALPSPEENAARASSYSDFTPAGKFGKTEVNTPSQRDFSLAASVPEKISLNKTGQWSIEKVETKPATKGLCPKCHAKKCQCGKDGVLVD